MAAGTRGGGVGREQRWTPERVREELLAFAEELGHQPSDRDFVAHGRRDLSGAMSYYGGRGEYREVVAHLPPPSRRPDAKRPGRARGSGRWNPDTVRAELEAYTQGMTRFPTGAEFQRDNQGGLHTAMSRSGGVRYWAEQLGLSFESGQDRTPYLRADALRDARELIAQHGWMPGKDKVRALGYPKLATYMAVTFRGGGKEFLEVYAHELDLPPWLERRVRAAKRH